MARARWAAAAPALLGVVVVAGCGRRPAGEPAGKPSATPTGSPRARAQVTILFTSDEHGWLLAHDDKGHTAGGAAELLGRWVRDEGHCPGPPIGRGAPAQPSTMGETPIPPPRAPTDPACPDPGTLALSGGDNFTGPAVSSYFAGGPMADAMARMGYAASAFGNHELDFGRARFVENRGRNGVLYLAANLHAPAAMKEMALPAFAIFERRGLKIGVVGLATDTTLQAAMASRFEGITFEAEEPALGRAVHDAWDAGADVVVAIAHECPDVLAPIVARHPEWKLAFVGAGHCHKKMIEQAGSVPVIAPGWRLDRYLRVRIDADPGRPRGERVLAVEPTVVEVSGEAGGAPAAPPDPDLAHAVADWKGKVDAALGEAIGWAGVDLPMQSDELGRWVTDAWRAELGAEVAVVNRHGLRQGLPKGAITKASVWSVLPFDNEIVLLKMRGSALARTLGEDEVVAGGVSRDGARWKVGGAVIDPERVYSVATIDFLYYGGHFGLKSAVAAEDRGIDWRAPVIAWTEKQRTSKAAPLERLLVR